MAAPKRHVFTSESVTEGHPDKVADQISDAVLDAILARDPAGRVACETLVTTGMAVVAGEITTKTYVHIPDLVRETVEAHRLHRRDLRHSTAAPARCSPRSTGSRPTSPWAWIRAQRRSRAPATRA